MMNWWNWEKETGVTLANSPTVNVGYEAVDELPKEAPARVLCCLPLARRKAGKNCGTGCKGNPANFSWKLDGLTIVLTYREGKLAKAVTRGNGGSVRSLQITPVLLRIFR